MKAFRVVKGWLNVCAFTTFLAGVCVRMSMAGPVVTLRMYEEQVDALVLFAALIFVVSLLILLLAAGFFTVREAWQRTSEDAATGAAATGSPQEVKLLLAPIKQEIEELRRDVRRVSTGSARRVPQEQQAPPAQHPPRVFPNVQVLCDPSSLPVGAAENSPPRVPSGPCHACGVYGHWRKDCPMRDYRCENCHRIGHVSAACRNYVLKDSAGRVRQMVQPRDNRIQMEAAVDSTSKEKVVTAQDVLNEVLQMAKRKSEKAKEKRDEKKKDTPPKRKTVSHPVGAVSSSPSSGGGDTTLEQVLDAVKVVALQEESDHDE